MSLQVLSAVSEIFPLVKTGGLGDVAGALPLALRDHGIKMTSLVPGYPDVMTKLGRRTELLAFDDLFGGPAKVISARASSLDLFAIDAPHLFGRAGNPYTDASGKDWPDNAFRFGALAFVAARLAQGAVPAYRPDILHCHDWQAGLAPAYLRFGGVPHAPAVVTIHNLAYQGLFPASLLGPLKLPPESFGIDGVEYYGEIGFLKAGLNFADAITTVSPSYAREIQTPEFGHGLDGLLRHRASVLTGIVNGIDTKIWNPVSDRLIPARFGRTTIQNRAPNVLTLRRRFGLAELAGRLLIGMVSRLVWQKGADIFAEAAPALVAGGMDIALLGTGDAALQTQWHALAAGHPGRVAFLDRYDEELAHLMQAGIDVLVVPSRFEPCGVTQLCAMRYGAVPVVAKVGGLQDTVTDIAAGQAATGFHIGTVTREALLAALTRAREAWVDRPRWRKLQENGMRSDVSWTASADRYAKLYLGLKAAAASRAVNAGHVSDRA